MALLIAITTSLQVAQTGTELQRLANKPSLAKRKCECKCECKCKCKCKLKLEGMCRNSYTSGVCLHPACIGFVKAMGWAGLSCSGELYTPDDGMHLCTSECTLNLGYFTGAMAKMEGELVAYHVL